MAIDSLSSPISGEVNVVMISCVSVSVASSLNGTCLLFIMDTSEHNILFTVKCKVY